MVATIKHTWSILVFISLWFSNFNLITSFCQHGILLNKLLNFRLTFKLYFILLPKSVRFPLDSLISWSSSFIRIISMYAISMYLCIYGIQYISNQVCQNKTCDIILNFGSFRLMRDSSIKWGIRPLIEGFVGDICRDGTG